ncbi:hypothetical protein [Acanthopleuribacter pedis]|uniref:Uncharacterized protein n=1 Tax=Acanthopleuribacter pedis TaxID=442870 RepID=A0A8J7Q9M1_9BACT|nr:hypothetical protein [Acanthopleuribacter pedis]MBO1319504.1 hypothetical protein [Acanthopleuribacter pedis]
MPTNQEPSEPKIVPPLPKVVQDPKDDSRDEVSFYQNASEQAPSFHTRTGESSKEQQTLSSIQLRGLQQDIDERKNYASKVYWLVCFWLGFIALMFILQGFNFFGFKLDNEVLKWAVVTMGLNVLGLLFAVIRYLFDRGGKLTIPNPNEEITSMFSVPGGDKKKEPKKK